MGGNRIDADALDPVHRRMEADGADATDMGWKDRPGVERALDGHAR